MVDASYDHRITSDDDLLLPDLRGPALIFPRGMHCATSAHFLQMAGRKSSGAGLIIMMLSGPDVPHESYIVLNHLQAIIVRQEMWQSA